MKRKLIGLICVCMLLSGCRTGSFNPVQTEPSEAATEQETALETSSNLRYVPHEAVESMTAPEVRLLGNGLLLSEYRENTVILKHISLEEEMPVTEGAVPAGVGTKLSIGSGEIGLCDRESGQISILDETFRLQRAYDVPAEGDDWYLNSELDTLYIFFTNGGLLARNLETGKEIWLVDNASQVIPKAGGTGYLIFDYTDRENQRTYSRCLNLSTATMEMLPIDGALFSGIRQGETWLLEGGEAEGFYMLVKGDAAHCFTWTDSPVRLLSSRRHLLTTDPAGRNLTLYDSDGGFLSRCALPQSSDAIVGTDFVWSGYWKGYFFTDFVGSSCRLMFWDVEESTDGENLQMVPLEHVQPVQPVPERQLYERAAQLSQRFGVDICIAEQCTLDYSHYDAHALTDPFYIRSALDILEQSLERYPEGFFRQLPYGSVETIRVELVGGFSAKDGMDTHPADIGAFAQERGSYYTVVLDGFQLQKKTVFHEFSHIVDAHLEWDSFAREDALYSENAWMALQPEGFRYTMSYTDVPENLMNGAESDYFITAYSMTFPTEDRAVLLAAAMENESWEFEAGSGRREKLQFYADCIRDCFDTGLWPETTAWEQVLNQ